MTSKAGEFQFVFAFDVETTGLCFNSSTPVHNVDKSEYHQVISWGIAIADAKTFEPIETLYLEVKWNDKSKEQREINPHFGKRAEEVHGLTYEHLEEHGVTEEEAVVAIASLIMKYFSTESCVKTLGHNVMTFDLMFLRDLLTRYELHVKFGNRHYCSNSLSLGTVGAFNSDDLFSTLGFDQRESHNALDDALMSLASFQIISTLWREQVGLLSYDD